MPETHDGASPRPWRLVAQPVGRLRLVGTGVGVWGRPAPPHTGLGVAASTTRVGTARAAPAVRGAGSVVAEGPPRSPRARHSRVLRRRAVPGTEAGFRRTRLLICAGSLDPGVLASVPSCHH